jgi:hypothetical protein
MEKKQTAVELLEQQLKERYSLMNSEPLFEQAKEMHKEQMIDAYEQGDKYKLNFSGEQYYNETYGGV